MLLNDLIPKTKLSEDSVKKSYSTFIRELSKPENRGFFSSINPYALEDILSAFKAELSQSNYQSLVEEDHLRYQNIIFGMRQYKRYVFCIDDRNSLNREIKKSIDRKPLKLDFDNRSYLFYLILNVNDLDSLLTAFFRWLIIVTDPVE